MPFSVSLLELHLEAKVACHWHRTASNSAKDWSMYSKVPRSLKLRTCWLNKSITEDFSRTPLHDMLSCVSLAGFIACMQHCSCRQGCDSWRAGFFARPSLLIPPEGLRAGGARGDAAVTVRDGLASSGGRFHRQVSARHHRVPVQPNLGQPQGGLYSWVMSPDLQPPKPRKAFDFLPMSADM